jgi:hypothetical protein
MLPDGTLESFDMVFAQPFVNQEEAGPEGTTFPGSARQKRQSSADVLRAMAFMDESLRDYQGYRIPVRGNPNRFQFPYAVYLEKGHQFENIDTGEVFVVEEVIKDEKGQKTGDVILSSGSGRLPEIWDRLRPVPKNRVRFFHAFPKALSDTYKFDEDARLVQVNKPWTDTITWRVERQEPGSLGRAPFTGTRETKPRHREFVQEDGKDCDCDYVRAISGQLFDTVVQFDIWAQSNHRAVILLEWFTSFFELYRWVWKYNGVKEILFWRQTADALVTRWRNDIVSRSLQLYFQTERLHSHRIRKLQDIEVTVDVLTHGEHLLTPASVVDPTGCVDPTGRIPVGLVDGVGEIFP